METAVEWLVKQLQKEWILEEKDLWIIQQAKEMEKQQIIEAHGDRLIVPKSLGENNWITGEEYYNKYSKQ